MNPRNTFLLVVVAAGVFVFIYFVEPRLQKPTPGPARVMPELRTNSVTAVQVLTSQFEIRAERIDAGWRLIKPLAYPAQSAAIDQLLAVVAELAPQTRISAEELAGRHSVDEEYGFEPPLATLVFQQDGEPHQLKLGKFTAPGDGIYAEVVGGASVDIIDAAFFKELVPHQANDWRNTNFVELKEQAFDHLTVASGTQAFELRRDATNQTWRMTKPVLTRADSPKTEYLLNKLRGLGVIRFVTDDAHADLEGYGLQPAGLELNLEQGTNSVLALQFGKSPTNDETVIYARHSGQNTIVLVSREAIAPWQKGYQEFRDRHLVRLADGPPDVIQVLGRDKELFTVERRTNDTWQVLAPYDFPADTNLMRAFLVNLAGLEVLRSNNEVAVKDTVLPDSDFPKYGLKTPARSYILKRNEPARSVVAELDFGLEEDGKIYARRGDQPDETSVYAVQADDFRKLPASGLDLRARRIWDFLEDDVMSVTIRQNGQTQRLVHNAPNKWTPAGGPIVNELELEVGAEELGLLEAQSWVARSDQDRAKYGFTEKSPRLSVEVQLGGKARTLTVDFGGRAPDGSRYGAAQMADGQNWIFEFQALPLARLTEYFHIAENPAP